MEFKVVSTNSVDKPLYNLQNKLAYDFESYFLGSWAGIRQTGSIFTIDKRFSLKSEGCGIK